MSAGDGAEWPAELTCAVAAFACAAGEPACAGVAADCAPNEPACGAEEGERVAAEAAAEDERLPAAVTGLEPAVARPLDGVELTGRAVAPTGAGPTEAGFPAAGPAGARAPAPAPGCADVLDALVSLLARSLAALAASPIRDPESEMLLSGAAAAREVDVVADRGGAAGVVGEVGGPPRAVAEVDRPVAGVLAAALPMAGIPNPAGEVGLAPARAAWPAGAAAGADKGRELGIEAEVDAGDAVADADLSAEGDLDAEAEPGPEAEPGAEAEADAEAEMAAPACEVFAGNAAAADVDVCDVAPDEVGAEAPLPAESVFTGPSGSNNWSSPRSSSESCAKDDSEDTPVEGLARDADAAASFRASSRRSESPEASRLPGLINSCSGSSGLTPDPAALREEAPEDGDVAPMGTLPSMGASTGRSVSGSKTGRDAASIVSSPL